MPKRLSEKEIFSTKYFKIKDVELQFENGNKPTYQVLEKPDSTIIVPVNDDLEVLFVTEYFAAIDEYQFGLPGGRIDAGEKALESANSELQEEIGFKAKTLEKLTTVTLTPGYLSQKTDIFLARGLVESKLDTGDENEELPVSAHSIDSFENLMESSQLTEARYIAALYLTRKFLKR